MDCLLMSKKYNFDQLSPSDITTLIEEKIQKEKDKIIQVWDKEGIRIEKARWGRSNIIKGKQKVELGKDIDATKLSLEQAVAYLDAAKPKKKTRKKSR